MPSALARQAQGHSAIVVVATATNVGRGFRASFCTISLSRSLCSLLHRLLFGPTSLSGEAEMPFLPTANYGMCCLLRTTLDTPCWEGND